MFPSPSVPVIASFNHVLGQAAWARGKLQPFAGRSVRIAMFPFGLTFAVDRDGYLEAGDATGDAVDLDIELPADAPLLALQGNDRVMKAARINGPADLANALSFVLGNLRWDIEEDLSKVFGDIAAHRIVEGLNVFATWQRQAVRNLAENVGEYLVEENQALAKGFEIDAFADDVRQFQGDLASLGSRIERLQP